MPDDSAAAAAAVMLRWFSVAEYPRAATASERARWCTELYIRLNDACGLRPCMITLKNPAEIATELFDAHLLKAQHSASKVE